LTKLGDSTACLLSIDPRDYLCEIEEVSIAKVISVSEDNFRGVVKLADGRTVSFERDRLVDILDIEVNRPVTRFLINNEPVIAILSAFGNTSLIKLENGRTLMAENSTLIEKCDDRLIDTVSLLENRNIHLDTITFYDPIGNQLREALVQSKKIIVPPNKIFKFAFTTTVFKKITQIAFQ